MRRNLPLSTRRLLLILASGIDRDDFRWYSMNFMDSPNPTEYKI
jgi:hypothetical protein